MENLKIDWTRINNDVNGNPRYVCHYTNLITENDQNQAMDRVKHGNKFFVEYEYETALKRAKKIGGRKFHNKQYGGGIVFQEYNLQKLEEKIFNLLSK